MITDPTLPATCPCGAAWEYEGADQFECTQHHVFDLEHLRALTSQPGPHLPDASSQGGQVLHRATSRSVRVVLDDGASAIGPGVEQAAGGHERNGRAYPSQEKQPSRAFALTRVGDLLSEPAEETPYVVEDTLPAGGTSILVAKPKVGKSTLARNLALAVARGVSIVGRATSPGPVVYLALEEKRAEVQKHFDRMGAGTADDIYIHVGVAPEDALAALVEAIKEHKPVLCIVDPLGRFVRFNDINDYAQVTRELEPVVALARESGCHILMVHHLGKMDRSDGDGVLGSTALFGAVDALLTMRRRDDSRVISTIQRYGTDLPETIVRMDPVTGAVEGAGTVADHERDQLAARISEEVAGDEQLTEADIRDRLGGNTGKTSKVIRHLYEQGYLHRTGGGRRGDPYKYCFSCFLYIDKREKQENEKPARRCALCPATLDPDDGDLCGRCEAEASA
jgi:hypothetical protein